jgi:hypothetical protein
MSQNALPSSISWRSMLRLPRHPMKYWEIIADNLSKAGWSWGCSSEVDSTGRLLFTADAYSRDGRRFTVLSDQKNRAGFWNLSELQVSR